MKRFRYILSGTAMILLTALFMVLPILYDGYFDAKAEQAKVRTVQLEPAEQEFTRQQMLQILLDNGSNCLYAETEADKPVSEYTEECRKIIREVFGSGYISERLIGEIETGVKNDAVGVGTGKSVCLYMGEPVVFNTVSVDCGNLHIYYEEEIGISLNITFYNFEPADESEMLSSELYDNTAVTDYYRSLGLKEGEFEYYTYNYANGGEELIVGIVGRAASEY